MDPETYHIDLKQCMIRPNKTLNIKARAETAWTAEIGVFKKYLKENSKNLVEKCFENDWEYMKDVAKKYKKSEEAEVKAEIKKVYKQIKELYRD